MQILSAPPLLTAMPSGDVLELHPSGSWTAANVSTLELLSAAVTPQVDRSNSVRVDMTQVRELDTLGAWLIEKMSRRGTPPGRRAEVVSVAKNYGGLIKEVRQVNRRNPPPEHAPNPVLAKLNDVGRSAISATDDVRVFLQML